MCYWMTRVSPRCLVLHSAISAKVICASAWPTRSKTSRRRSIGWGSGRRKVCSLFQPRITRTPRIIKLHRQSLALAEHRLALGEVQRLVPRLDGISPYQSVPGEDFTGRATLSEPETFAKIG